MKQRFLEGGVPCAKGRLIKSVEETDDMAYPVIVKPRDNSGSRGVKLCWTREDLIVSMAEALEYSKLDSVLVEEFIEGQEFSIEAFHFDGKSEVIQFTEKKTTEFPYNVELGHKQPANLTEEQKSAICDIVSSIGRILHFEHCPSHTELKINEHGIFVIETSPRLGGDYITSTLVPLSTSINMEDQLLRIAFGESIDMTQGRMDYSSGIAFFHFPEGIIKSIDNRFYDQIKDASVYSLNLRLRVGDRVNQITSSANRYGEFIVRANNRKRLDHIMTEFEEKVRGFICIE